MCIYAIFATIIIKQADSPAAIEDSSVKISVTLTPVTSFRLTSFSHLGVAYNNLNASYRKSRRQVRQKIKCRFFHQSTSHSCAQHRANPPQYLVLKNRFLG